MNREEWRNNLLNKIEVAKDKPFVVRRHKFKNSKETLEMLAPIVSDLFKK